MVERQLPKLYVEGSIPFARSNLLCWFLINGDLNLKRIIPAKVAPYGYVVASGCRFPPHDRANNRRRLVKRGHTLCSRTGAGFADYLPPASLKRLSFLASFCQIAALFWDYSPSISGALLLVTAMQPQFILDVSLRRPAVSKARMANLRRDSARRS